MTLNERLESWLITNRLDYIIWTEKLFTINGFGKGVVIEPKPYLAVNDILFNKDFKLIFNDEELTLIDDEELAIDFLAYEFGGKWYYCEDPLVTEFKELKYLGKEVDAFEEAFPFLAVHGAYDLCNGSRLYPDWCKKAKFANYTSLGIAEENTLAGTLAFQNACSKAGIKSIIGETVTVEDAEGDKYIIKLYVVNETGWKNLLNINAEINVFNESVVPEAKLLERSEGLNCILTPEVNLKAKLKLYKAAKFTELYFQFDVSKWDSDERDKKILLSTQDYLKNYRTQLRPALISDAYYLDSTDGKIRRDLNAIGQVPFKNQSKDQFFKTPMELYMQVNSLFDVGEQADIIIGDAMNGAVEIAKTNFKIDTGKLYLPAYEMTKEESSIHETNESLFWYLVEVAMHDKIFNKGKDEEKYVERLEIEMKVILEAKLHDYFLIIWDILNWCNNVKGWPTGYGRGSAAGSLVAYLLGIVQTDPLEYDLLFERFLNEGRLYKKKKVKGYRLYWNDQLMSESQELTEEMKEKTTYPDFEIREEEIEIKVTGSMPDIDNDVPGEHRDEIKRYIEEKYGQNRVASIGTYGTMKIKGALQGLARRSGVDTAYANYVTGAIKDDKITVTDLFILAQKDSTFDKSGFCEKNSFVKEFIQNNPELIHKLSLVYGQPRTASIHAGGVIIVPPSENGIYDWLPIKMVDGVLVSEWEMEEVEQAGFLKMDILGLKQLDKFAHMIQLIKETTGKHIDVKDIPLDDPQVYELFGQGFNEDVFQFKGFGLKSYTANLKPETIDDLIATVALYRPGPIEIGTHNQYVKRKNGLEDVVYPRGTEQILKNTYGLMTYQEQVQQIAVAIAGFTPNEADDVRKAIGKKLPELMAQQKDKFIEGAVKNNYPRDEANWLWDQIEVFATYSFNKSHATCYAITGYHSQWLKANYPLQFWTTSLTYSEPNAISGKLAEIYAAFPQIKIAPPDINKSTIVYQCDPETNFIYWTISSVKQVGEAAVKAILEEREKSGEFFSVVEFATRMKPYSRAVKKNTIENLIMAGAFDEVHQIKKIEQRFDILVEYAKFARIELTEEQLAMKKWRDYHFIVLEKSLSGLGILDFRKMIKNSKLSGKMGIFMANKDILETPVAELPPRVMIGGLIEKYEIKEGRKGTFMRVDLTDGETPMWGAMIWTEAFEKHKDILQGNLKNKLLVMTGEIEYNEAFKKANQFKTTNDTVILFVE